MKRFLIVLLMVMVASLSYGAGSPDFNKSFTAKQGTVVFNHTKHSKVVECAKCHSLFQGGVNKDNAHKACKSCHQEKGGPTKCGDCHKK